MPTDREEDITIRLALAALDPESVEPAEMEALLPEAILIINVLRAAAKLRADIEAGDIKPAGNA